MRGFSLIEVVLALGVIAFAIVGIMGLFPVAMRAGLESQRETRATLIARQLMEDLKAGGTNAFVVIGDPTGTHTSLTNLLGNSSTNYIAYDDAGKSIHPTIAASVWLTGSNAPTNAAYLARLAIQTNTPTPGLATVEATIQAPAPAPSTNRSSYTFVTLMRQSR